jgi:ABC-2 type transport system permease protein
MRKILWLAQREYKVSVRTKGFVIGLIIFPILMGGSGMAIALLKDRVDTTTKTIAVIDRSGVVADSLKAAADKRNATGIFKPRTGEQIKPAYMMQLVEPNDDDPKEQRLELSNRIRMGELHGFVEIDSNAVHPIETSTRPTIAYYAVNAAMDDAKSWMEGQINLTLRMARLAEAGIRDSEVQDLFDWVGIQGLGLITVDEQTGAVRDARLSNEGEAILVPAILGMLMFMMIMMGAVPLLHSVMEEKTQRIAEVLLGAVTPFEFMAGKVLGGVAVSLTAAAVYVAVSVMVFRQVGMDDFIPYRVLPWFFVYMVMAIVMYGAMLAALGASCNEAKDAQNLTMPGLMPVMIPMFLMFPVLKEPLTGFATWLSLVPIFTPMMMMIRIGTPAAIPAWQPWAGLAGVLAVTIVSVWTAGRIFRVAILMQGRPPRLGDLFRWAFRG